MSTDRKVLGRGLGALIGGSGLSSKPPESASDILKLSVNEIIPNAEQPREHFRMDKLLELADSIKNKGVIQPIIVRRITGGKYQIVAGERRYRASKLAGLDIVPAIVRDLEDDELLETALIENIQRENLNPLEEALAYQGLLEKFGYTQEELAKRLGKSRAALTNAVRLLKLPDEIKSDIVEGALSAGHARAILGMEQPELMLAVREQVLDKKLSVRETEQLIRNELSAEKPKTHKAPAKKINHENAELKQSSEILSRVLSMQVQTEGTAKSGKIVIYYSTTAEFNRVYQLLSKPQ